MFGYGWCSGMGVGGWLLMAFLWAGFLAVIIWAVTRLFPRTRPGKAGGENATSVLDRRLAAGEIDEETYERLRGELTRTG
jgi:putative membrane protein